MKRFVSIDLLRGIAILGMIALHIFIVVFNTDVLVNAFQKGQGSVVLVIVAVIIAYFSSFAGLFFVISAISHIASMWRQYERAEEKTPKIMNKILKGQIYRGLILFGIGYFIEVIFWPYFAAVFPKLMTGESFSGFWSQIWSELFWFNVIQSLGLASIFIALVFHYCMRKGKTIEQTKRIFAYIVIIIFAATPFVLTAIRGLPYFGSSPHANLDKRSLGVNILYWFLTWFAGYEQAVFPWHAMAFIGAIIGLDLVNKPVTKKFVRKWMKWGLLMIVIGFLWQAIAAIVENFLPQSQHQLFELGFGIIFGFSGPSTGYMLFAGGGEVIITVLIMGLVEGKKRAASVAKKTTFLRRAGMIALSLYTLQYFAYIPIILFEWAFGLTPLAQQGNWWEDIIMIVSVTAIFIFVPWLWEKIKFKGSLEWVSIRIITGREKHAKDRLDPQETLYNITPLGQPEQEVEPPDNHEHSIENNS